MGRQSSRIYFQGKDHKDIYFQGHYHDKMYIGSQLVWEKLKSGFKSKYYTGFPYWATETNVYAENGNCALFSSLGSKYAYMTEDFVSVNTVLAVDKHMCGEVEYDELIDRVYYMNGKFFVRTYFYKSNYGYSWYNGGFVYSSSDGENWNQIDTFVFDTNGFKGSWKLDQRGEKIQQITVLNNIAFMYLDGKRTDEYDDSDLVASGNDYAHLLGGLYISTDFKNWKSVNTHFFMQEEKKYGVVKTYYYPLGIYTGGPYLYKDGYYYTNCRTLDPSLNYADAQNNMTELALRRTSDLKTTELVSAELGRTSIYSFGKYFYVPNYGLTTDFLEYTPTDGFLKVPQKTITVPQYKARREFTYTVNEESVRPFITSAETENYIFAYIDLSELVENYYYGSATKPSKTIYTALKAMIVIDKKDESNVIEIFPVFYPVYDYATGEIVDDYTYKYAIGIEEKKPYLLSKKEIAGFYSYDYDFNSAILIVGKEV